MNERIIYQNNDGGVSIIIPTGELAIEEVAKKDVPANVPYKIVDAKDIPSDRTFRDAWEANITAPDGLGLGYDAWFALQPKPVEVENDNG
jgi:hypothetical protein